MDLIAPSQSVDVEAIDSFADASTFLVSMLHSPKLNAQWQPVSPPAVRDGNQTADLLIEMLWNAEKPVGADQMLIMLHPIIYYHVQKSCRSIVQIETHKSAKGYSGTILGHRFFSHARIRPDTLLVAAKVGELSKVLVASPTEWTPESSLVT